MYSNDPRYRPMVRVNALPASQLLAMVLGITSLGFAITGLTAYLTQGVSPLLSMVAFFAGLILIFVMSANRSNPGLSLMLFYTFTALEGVGIAPMIERFIRAGASDVIVNAALTTAGGMAMMGAVVYASSFDFRKLQGIAFASLIALLIIGFLNMFIHVVHPQTYAWATLAIFSLLVLVDFGRVRAGGDGLTPVEMAISIYLDGLNIFLALLEIFGIRSRD